MKQEIYDELTAITQEKRLEIIERHRENGVMIPCTDGVIIGENVKIEPHTLILKGVMLLGETEISEGCRLGPDCLISSCTVGAFASLNCAQCFDSEICESADVGPFVQVRPGSRVGRGAHLGNFVEVKNSDVGEGTKVSHLTYVGDSDVGKNVNFGCGCVTVNYTGRLKFRTTIGDSAFIGCNTNLVAPVCVGDYAYIAAGSTITEDVPENALGIARARQVNKSNWVLKRKPYKGME